MFTVFVYNKKIQLNGVRIEDETEFSYEAKGPKGPAKWGTLKKEWKLCGIGKLQSPINLTDENVKVTSKLGSLRSRYLPSNATIKNRGHDIMVNQLLNFPIYIYILKHSYFFK